MVRGLKRRKSYMLFTSSETQIYQELLTNAVYLGVTTTSIQEALRKIAQQNRNKVTSIATLKTYLNSNHIAKN